MPYKDWDGKLTLVEEKTEETDQQNEPHQRALNQKLLHTPDVNGYKRSIWCRIGIHQYKEVFVAGNKEYFVCVRQNCHETRYKWLDRVDNY